MELQDTEEEYRQFSNNSGNVPTATQHDETEAEDILTMRPSNWYGAYLQEQGKVTQL
jgi:hypothetical protein